MAYPRMGRTKQLTIRLRPDTAVRLAAVARSRGVAQTVIIEELIHTLPEPRVGEGQEIKLEPSSELPEVAIRALAR
jgi:hypothetical protein